MYENDVPNLVTSLLKRARKKLTFDARTRFIFLFTLFNAMFCLLALLLMQNMELAEDKREMATRVQSLEESLEEVVAGAQETVVFVATQIAQFEASRTITPACSSTVAPTSVLTTPTNTSIQPAPTGTVTVTPTALADPPPLIFNITPNSGTIAASAITVTLQGSAFAPGAMVEMQREGESPIIARDVNVICPTQITGVLDLTRATTGTWSVRVINSDQQSAVLPDAFKVHPAGSQ